MEIAQVSFEPRHSGVVAHIDRCPSQGGVCVGGGDIEVFLPIVVVDAGSVLILRIVGAIAEIFLSILSVE